MKCKSKTVRSARLIAVSVAVLCGLCVCFVSCNEEADEEEVLSYTTYNADGTLGSSGLSQSEWESLLASISGESTIVLSSELTSEDLATFAAALIASGKTGIKLDLSSLSILSIAAGTFSGCTGITSVVLPESVVSIGEDAFSGCTSLVSLTIGSSLVSVGEDAFSGCTALTLVTYSGTTDDWEDILVSSGNECLTGATVVCSDGRITGSGNTSSGSTASDTVTASYSGEGEDELSGVAIKVTASGGTISSVSIDGSTVSANSDGTYTYTVEGTNTSTVYTITLVYDSTSDAYTYTYVSAVEATVTASYSGSGTNALSGYTFTVTYVTDTAGSTTISTVVASISGADDTELSGTDGVYTLSVTGEGGYEALYTITFVYSGGAVSYTYTVTAVEDTEATGGLSGYGVHVKYTSSDTTYTVRALAVDDGANPVTLSADDDGTYTYTVDSEGLYTSDEDSIATTYTITLVTTSAPSYSYTYTYVATTTSDYTATGDISGVVVSVNATVSETYNGSSSTYTVDSINGVSAASSSDGTSYTVTSSSSGTYSFTVDSGTTTTTYTITLTESTSGGVSYSYSYEASEYFGSSDTDYAGFVTLLSALSDGCTIVLYPYLSSTQLEWFADALTESSLSA